MYGINNECKLKIIMYRNRNNGNLVIFFYITGSSKSFVLEKRVTISYSSTSPKIYKFKQIELQYAHFTKTIYLIQFNQNNLQRYIY